MSRSPQHASYLEQLGIGQRPLIVATRRRQRPSGRQSRVIGVFCENDLRGLRGQIFWRLHDDEVREGLTVTIKRGGRDVGRIDCGSAALAWDCERICAGIRLKRGAE